MVIGRLFGRRSKSKRADHGADSVALRNDSLTSGRKGTAGNGDLPDRRRSPPESQGLGSEDSSSTIAAPGPATVQSLVSEAARSPPDAMPEKQQVNTLESSSTTADTDTSTIGSLWDQAYAALHAQNKRLVDDYEILLSRELLDAKSHTSVDDDGDNVEETQNCLENNTQRRQAQLKTIIEGGLQRAEAKKITYTIAGHEMVLQDQIAQAANMVQWAKGLIDEAVKASPEASLIWAGVSLILPLLTLPSVAEQAKSDGFTYVTARMRFYEALEPLIFVQKPRPARRSVLPEDLRKEFKSKIVELYRHILEFQLQSVLHFYRSRRRNFGRAIIGKDGWKSMLDLIQELESSIDRDLQKLNDSVVRQQLERISDVANRSQEYIEQIVVIAGQQLQTQSKILQVNREGFQGISDLLRDVFDVQEAVNLPIIDDARYRSAEVQDQDKCQEHTRVSIQQRIMEWAEHATGQTIFWLSGPAGTGKSTIARTVADSLLARSRLAAGYFFNSKKNEQGRNNTERFFTTVASQLIASIPEFNDHLKKSLARLGSANVEKASIEEQFEVLIQTPLTRVAKGRDTSQKPMLGVIVVDALDECIRRDHISRMINLLLRLRSIHSVQLRVLITSRSSDTILGAFKTLDNIPDAYHRLALESDFAEETRADITTFLTTQFEKIKTESGILDDPWPPKEDLNRLVDLATTPSPLFVYAATVCRFVYSVEHEFDDPAERLSSWLEQCDRNASQLRQIYEPILNDLFVGGRNQNLQLSCDAAGARRTQGMKVLAALVLVVTPVSATVLAALVSLRRNVVIQYIRGLHAVLQPPDTHDRPVTLFHKSFSDFLLDDTEGAPVSFRVDARETHRALAASCMRIMGNLLRQDICSLGDPSKQVEDAKSVVKNCIPPELIYASLHWVHHLLEGVTQTLDGQGILEFLQCHFVHWVEVLCLLERLSDGIVAIKHLLGSISEHHQAGSSLGLFLKDADRWLLNMRHIIEQEPLQIYASALVFCPTQIQLRTSCWGTRLPFIKNEMGTRDQWLPCFPLSDDGDENHAVFSPDGQTLAVLAFDIIRLYNVTTGTCQRTLCATNGFNECLAFSPDMRWIASGTDEEEVNIWDVISGSLERQFVLQDECVFDLAFSPDSNTIAAATTDCLVLFNLLGKTHTPSLSMEMDHNSIGVGVKNLTFLRHGRQLAGVVGANSDLIQFWDTETAALLRTLSVSDTDAGLYCCITDLSLSLDGTKLLAALVPNKIIVTWDLSSEDLSRHDQEMSCPGPAQEVSYSGHFSKDGTLVAYVSVKNHVVCDVVNGAQRHILNNHHAMRANFSPDCKMIALDGAPHVWLWDLTTSPIIDADKIDQPITAVAISARGTTIAVGFQGSEVQIWEPATRRLVQRLDLANWASLMAFSQDVRTIAVVLQYRVLQLWDIANGVILLTVESDNGKIINHLAFSHDGRCIAVGVHNRVRVRGVETGADSLELHMPGCTIRDLTFTSLDDRIAVSCYHIQDKTSSVMIWDAATGALLSTTQPSWLSDYYFLGEPYHVPKEGLGPVRLHSDGPDVVDRHAIMFCDDWIVRGGRRLLRLPLGNRPERCGSKLLYASSSNAVVIGHEHGHWTFVEFSF